ncbi:transmembrane protein 26 [Teleopsis dalmanni]|uniref:transmembrane protein 26 n=1 Tax=Teleopsis dalmanni TaxID=139649 RepID=UPI0018CDA99D|nr:transmembrane protein 26 [Teleopsis dalmanni]
MAKIISTIKAILTRIIFSAHSMIAIWQVTENKGEIIYWTLCGPLFILLLEAIFTLMIKKTQEWRWFCPSVFLYLGSIVPAIWLLELDKVERRLSGKSNTGTNASDQSPLDKFDNLLGDTGIDMPQINVDTWTTLIEQFLMLILIVGRWLLPKGDLTRDQLSQLLLVYIGTAADIIEFFDSYKDDSIAKIPLLVYLTLGIWSWSLLQFTIVLSATRARRPRGSGSQQSDDPTGCCDNCCCGIDVWGIVLNVILQDAPFLTFRLLIIFQYKIINYMNVFFTCKNSLVIILQLYRLYVVNAEFWKHRRELKNASKSRHYKSRRRVRDEDANSIYMISSERGTDMKRKIKRAKDYVEDDYDHKKKAKKDKKKKRKRKDTGYSTGSSQNLYSTKIVHEKDSRRKDKKGKKSKRDRSSSPSGSENVDAKKGRRNKNADKNDKKKSKRIEAVIEESLNSSNSSDSSHSTLPSYEVINEKKQKSKRHKRSSSSSSSTDSSDNSSSESS